VTGGDRPAGIVDAVTSSPAATRALAAELATLARPGDTVLLAGDLGAGKTTFAQGFAAGLGVEGPVTSPTFTLVRPYRCGPAGLDIGVRTLVHADVYRLDHLQEVVDLALVELVEDAAVALVEWGDVAAPVLGADALVVRIERGEDDDERRIELVPGASWAGRAGELARRLAPWARAVPGTGRP